MRGLLLWGAGLGVLVPAAADDGVAGRFEGRVVVEWEEGDGFTPALQLVEDFTFRQADGHVWRVPAGTVVDDKAIPPAFRDRVGPTFSGGFRKSAIVYNHATRAMHESWPATQRMFHEASVAEGVPRSEAKAMYFLLRVQGMRWERENSTCYGNCHRPAWPLSWWPSVDEDKLDPLLAWLRAEDPPLDRIDEQADAIMGHGPHAW